ncbi:MAG: virulence factor BrkB family protein [gamma proteobacterium symbiont of Taylorina sp.]|nr:virulence factor BrkB family protein [gamma proteobacterium symbiont of Taylorina sp.]
MTATKFYLLRTLNKIGRFYIFMIQRFFQQRCDETAASLSYTSLLSLVPMMAVIFAAFSSFPAFREVFEQLQSFIFNNLVPSSSEVIQEYLTIFVEKASKLTMVGMVSLFIIALMLMRQIDKSLNKIWGVHKNKNFIRTFLTYWAVLTLGPILMGLSIMFTSYLTSVLMIQDAADSLGFKKELLLILPVVMTMTAFTLIYMIVPNREVPILHALFGGFTATILFELSKKAFALYISNNNTYSNLYGALATIPIFLVWIYISWLVTLLGAMTARCMSLFDFSDDQIKQNENNLLSTFHILRLLSNAAKTGTTLSEEMLHKNIALRHETQLDQLIYQLEELAWIHKTENKEWSLAKDLDSISLWTLYSELPYVLPKTISTDIGNASLVSIIKQANVVLSKELDTPIKKLFLQYE